MTDPIPSAPPDSGPTFSKYKVLRRLAVGGMGEIFLARQTGVPGFERLIILKTMLPDFADDPKRIERFLDEARVAATLSHPNIVGIYEVGFFEGTYFIAMEYIHGATLSQLMSETVERTGEGLPTAIATRIVRDAAGALHHAHTATDLDGNALRVVHRDVSPQNIMIRIDGVTKVLDFGIAKSENRWAHTVSGTIMGKLGYMPPEQLEGGEVTAKSDQFALGVVYWELLSGRRLFQGDGALERIRSLDREPVPLIREHRPDVPEPISALIARMLSSERDTRCASCGEVVGELDAYLGALPDPITEGSVARVVEEMQGDKIREQLNTYGPAAENLVVSLLEQKGQPGLDGFYAPTVPLLKSRPESADPIPRPPGSKRWLIWGLVFGLAVVVGAGAQWLGRAQPEEAPPATSSASPTPSSPPSPAVTPPPPAPSEPQPRPRPPLDSSAASAARGPQPKPTKPASRVGFLSLRTQPWTSVFVDGRPYGSTPLFELRLEPGRHTLRMTNPGAGIDQERKITIVAGEVLKLELTLNP